MSKEIEKPEGKTELTDEELRGVAGGVLSQDSNFNRQAGMTARKKKGKPKDSITITEQATISGYNNGQDATDH